MCDEFEERRQILNKRKNDCTCIIYHPKDRTEAVKRLDYARKVNDDVGIVIALVQLAPCRTRGKA